MVSLILFLCVVYLVVAAVRSVSFGTVLALIMAAVGFYYHRKWERSAHPERYEKGGYP